MASDVTSLRQRLSTLVDTITRDIEIAETNRNLGTKHRLEQDLIQANQLARELEGQDILYGREFKQRIDTLRQRLDNLSRTPVYGAWNSGYDQEVDRLGHEQRDLLLRGHGSLLRTGDTLKTSHHIASETEQLGHEIMNDLTTQRETLLRVQDKLNEADQHLSTSRKILRLMYSRVITNKVLLITIIIIELLILGGVIYWKFFSKKK